MPVAADARSTPPPALSRFPPDHVAAAERFVATWETHRETAEQLRAIRHLVGVKGFELLLRVVVEKRDFTEAGFTDDRRGRQSGHDFLVLTLDALARKMPAAGRRGTR